MLSSQQSFNRNKLAVDYIIELLGSQSIRTKQDTGYNVLTPEGHKIRVCSAFPRIRKNSKIIRFTLTEKSISESTHLAFVEMNEDGQPIDCRITPMSGIRTLCKCTALPDGKSYSMSMEYDRVKEMENIMFFRTKGQKVIYIKEGADDHTHAYVQIPNQETEKVSRWTLGEFKCLICGKIRKLAIGMV